MLHADALVLYVSCDAFFTSVIIPLLILTPAPSVKVWILVLYLLYDIRILALDSVEIRIYE